MLGLRRECVHCLHAEIIKPMMGGYGSNADFCTKCDSPWWGTSIECEHCGTAEVLGNINYSWIKWENWIVGAGMDCHMDYHDFQRYMDACVEQFRTQLSYSHQVSVSICDDQMDPDYHYPTDQGEDLC